MKNLTCLDYAILWILRRRSLSGYEIRKIFETTNLGNFSSSPGTIYPALKRLQQLELIYPFVLPRFSTSLKKKFSIRPIGINKLDEWLNKPIEGVDVSNNLQELLLRLAFIDILMNKDQIIRFMKSFIIEFKKYSKKLEVNNKLASQGLTVIGKLYIDNSLAMYKSQLSWAKKALKTIVESRWLF